MGERRSDLPHYNTLFNIGCTTFNRLPHRSRSLLFERLVLRVGTIILYAFKLLPNVVRLVARGVCMDDVVPVGR